MSVEKMTMMNVIGNISDVDNVLKDIILSGKVDLVSALSQIEENSFVFNVKDENLEKVIDLNYITSFSKDKSYEELLKKGEELEKILNIESDYMKSDLKEDTDIDTISQVLNNIYEEVKEPSQVLNLTKEKLEKTQEFYKNFSEIRDINIQIDSLRDLSYFDFRFGILSKEDRIKLKKNYDNILAVILHTGTGKEGEVYLVLYPSNIKEEMNRILRSLNFQEIQLQEEYKGTPKELIEYLKGKKEKLQKEIDSLENTLSDLRETHKDTILSLVNQLRTKGKIEDIKEKLARSNKFFYLSGWVSKKDKEKIGETLKSYKDILTIFKDETDLTPPTKLRNIWLFKPFESLVKMYGMPSYNELDPTPFLSLSYMFLFGAMFGDLGQGLILLLAGILLGRKNKMFGGLLGRLGFSSMVFGTLYGAVFGLETVIPALLIKPFENINKVLVSAIFIGIALILISYIYGMINSVKRKDMEDGLFGKEGLAGFLFYLCLLILIGGNLLKKPILSMEVGVVIILLCIAVMIFKQPLTHLIKGKRPLHGEDVTGYYIESVFSIIETLLSMLSGTVSFIRVGAFALTHVGLFIAFETIGHMIGTTVGNIIVLIIGNIVIIGMEGLIVFIQGLRLQYYELFSRYYKGEGKEFKPVNIK
ncbi:V-type ATPase 116kDa subunit family protein [Tissierella praeacuta]|uniref:V-type ATP synthase subunit I n=1 Tax=Tissierella praeacuta TaxID=43131 RepID=UPI00333E8A5E